MAAGDLPLRRNRQFQLIWTAQAASMLGTELTRVAIPLLLLHMTGSPAQAGIVAAALTASMLVVQVPAGVWVDRWDRRRTLLLSQGFQVLNAAALMTALLLGSASLWNFIGFAAVDGACQAFLGPARDVAIRNVVPATQLRQAYTQEEARSHAARLVGPAAGGALYTANMMLPFIFDTLSFLIAWICTALSSVPRRPPSSQPAEDGEPATEARRKGLIREAIEAARWLIRQRGLREMTLIITAMNLLGGAFTIPVIVHIQEQGGSPTTTGLVLAGTGVGGLIGAVLSARITNRVPAGKLAIAVPAIFGICLGVAALPLASWWPIVPIVAFSLVTPSLNVAINALISLPRPTRDARPTRRTPHLHRYGTRADRTTCWRRPQLSDRRRSNPRLRRHGACRHRIGRSSKPEPPPVPCRPGRRLTHPPISGAASLHVLLGPLLVALQHVALPVPTAERPPATT